MHQINIVLTDVGHNFGNGTQVKSILSYKLIDCNPTLLQHPGVPGIVRFNHPHVRLESLDLLHALDELAQLPFGAIPLEAIDEIQNSYGYAIQGSIFLLAGNYGNSRL